MFFDVLLFLFCVVFSCFYFGLNHNDHRARYIYIYTDKAILRMIGVCGVGRGGEAMLSFGAATSASFKLFLFQKALSFNKQSV